MNRGLRHWLAHLEALHPLGIAGIELGLARVKAVQARLAQRQTVPVITVAGTNGKGSTCALIAAILGAAGYRVGLYTSPHLLRFNERIRIGPGAASDRQLCAAFARVEAARVAADTRLSYFEFATLAAWECFTAAAVDVAVLEVGLGGRLDAVNCYDADCAVIATIDFDHCDYLGNTRAAIGFEKAGIMRAGRPVVCLDAAPPRSIAEQARALGAELHRAGHEFGFRRKAGAKRWQYWSAAVTLADLPLPALAGAHQLANAAGALAALECLGAALPVSRADIERGLRQVRLPGRLDWQPGPPPVLVDVAHNAQAARTLAAHLAASPCSGATWAVFGMLRDKDIEAVIAAMQGQVQHWLPCSLRGARGASAGEVAAALARRGIAVPPRGSATPAAALRQAQEQANEGDRIVAFGSFLTVAGVLRQLARKA